MMSFPQLMWSAGSGRRFVVWTPGSRGSAGGHDADRAGRAAKAHRRVGRLCPATRRRSVGSPAKRVREKKLSTFDRGDADVKRGVRYAGLRTRVRARAALPSPGLHQLMYPRNGRTSTRWLRPQTCRLGTALGLAEGRRRPGTLVGLATLNCWPTRTTDGPDGMLVDDADWLDATAPRCCALWARRWSPNQHRARRGAAETKAVRPLERRGWASMVGPAAGGRRRRTQRRGLDPDSRPAVRSRLLRRSCRNPRALTNFR